MPPVLPTRERHSENCACAVHFYLRSVEPALSAFNSNRSDENWAKLKNAYAAWRVKVEVELQKNIVTVSRLEGMLDAGTTGRLEEVIAILEEHNDSLLAQYEEASKERTELSSTNAKLKEANKNLRGKLEEADSRIRNAVEDARRRLEGQYANSLQADREKIAQLEIRIGEYETVLANNRSLVDEINTFEAENKGLLLRIQTLEKEQSQEIAQIRQELETQYAVREQQLRDQITAEHGQREDLLKTRIKSLETDISAKEKLFAEAKTWQARINRLKAEEEELARQRNELAEQSLALADFRDMVTFLGGVEPALEDVSVAGNNAYENQNGLLAKLDEKRRKRLEQIINIETRAGRISSGFAKLDDVLQNGFPAGTSVAIVGSAHSPKDRLMYNLAIDSEQKGAPTLLITTVMRPKDVQAELEKLYGKPINNIEMFDAYNEDSSEMHLGKLFVDIERWLARVSSESKLLRPRVIIHTYDKYSSTAEYKITAIGGDKKVSLLTLRDLITDSNALLVCTMDQNRYAERREEWARVEDTFACIITLRNKPLTETNMLGQLTVQARGFSLRPNAMAKDLASAAGLDYKIDTTGGITLMPSLKREL